MTDLTRLQALEDLKKAKYLLMLVTVFNTSLFGVFSAVGAVTGLYALFTISFVFCLINAAIFANSYQRWKTL